MKGLIASEWGQSENKRKAKYCRLTKVEPHLRKYEAVGSFTFFVAWASERTLLVVGAQTTLWLFRWPQDVHKGAHLAGSRTSWMIGRVHERYTRRWKLVSAFCFSRLGW